MCGQGLCQASQSGRRVLRKYFLEETFLIRGQKDLQLTKAISAKICGSCLRPCGQSLTLAFLARVCFTQMNMVCTIVIFYY